MRSSRIFTISIVAMLLIGFSQRIAVAQAKTSEPERIIMESDGYAPEPGDQTCKYFTWSKFFTADQRVGFRLVMEAGKIGSENPKTKTPYLTIVLDESKTVPIARKTGHDDAANGYWVLSMNQATYDSESKCLVGVTVKK